MEKKIEMFAENMEIELMANKHKGDWNEWDNIEEMIAELEWHKAKLLLALRENNKTLVREYLADCGNILMFIGNAGHIFDGNEKYINRYRNGEIVYNGSQIFNRRETAENYGNTCTEGIYVDTVNAADKAAPQNRVSEVTTTERKDEKIKSGFIIYEGDEVNSFLVAALRSLSKEQMVMVRDNLIARTPKIERKDSTQVFCAICGKSITETGTVYNDKPVHIECYHKAIDRSFSMENKVNELSTLHTVFGPPPIDEEKDAAELEVYLKPLFSKKDESQPKKEDKEPDIENKVSDISAEDFFKKYAPDAEKLLRITSNEKYKQVIAAMEEYASQDKWVSIKDKSFLEDGEQYIVELAYKSENCVICAMYENDKFINLEDKQVVFDNVIRYQPLPLPSNQSKTDN